MAETKIKICGLTDAQETEYLNKNQVNFAGFVVFFEKSKRNITVEKAKTIMASLHPAIKRVAVTVSPNEEQVKQIAKAGFDYIQIHGELKPGVLDYLPVLKAFNISDMDQFDYFQSRPEIVGYVFDAAEPGSGKTFDWDLLKTLPRTDKLFFLAGGLNPENVQTAIAAVKPDVVDVSSGVEFGKEIVGKDPAKVDAFVKSVRES